MFTCSHVHTKVLKILTSTTIRYLLIYLWLLVVRTYMCSHCDFKGLYHICKGVNSVTEVKKCWIFTMGDVYDCSCLIVCVIWMILQWWMQEAHQDHDLKGAVTSLTFSLRNCSWWWVLISIDCRRCRTPHHFVGIRILCFSG